MLKQTPKRIIVHCSATPDNSKIDYGIKHITLWHKARGWRTCGYHEIIKRNGDCEFGRFYEEQGAGVKGYNKDTIHLCLIGTVLFAKKQIKQLSHTIELICVIYDISIENIYCHNEFTKKKTCPNFTGAMLRRMF